MTRQFDALIRRGVDLEVLRSVDVNYAMRCCQIPIAHHDASASERGLAGKRISGVRLWINLEDITVIDPIVTHKWNLSAVPDQCCLLRLTGYSFLAVQEKGHSSSFFGGDIENGLKIGGYMRMVQAGGVSETMRLVDLAMEGSWMARI